jgi:hypothetical protein
MTSIAISIFTGVEAGNDRHDLADRRRSRDRDRHHVVDQERGRRDQAPDLAEVLLRHRVGAAARRVGPADLAVRRRDDASRTAIAIATGTDQTSAAMPAVARTRMISWVA